MALADQSKLKLELQTLLLSGARRLLGDALVDAARLLQARAESRALNWRPPSRAFGSRPNGIHSLSQKLRILNGCEPALVSHDTDGTGLRKGIAVTYVA